jgi:hypothetical protein
VLADDKDYGNVEVEVLVLYIVEQEELLWSLSNMFIRCKTNLNNVLADAKDYKHVEEEDLVLHVVEQEDHELHRAAALVPIQNVHQV